MNEPATQKPKRKLTSLELSAPARASLKRIKSRGISKKAAVEQGIALFEAKLIGGVS